MKLNNNVSLYPVSPSRYEDKTPVLLDKDGIEQRLNATEAASMTGGDRGTEPVLHNRIQAIRTAKFMSLRELARMAKISKDTLNRIENGTAVSPDSTTMYKIAKALGVEPPSDIYVMDETLRNIVNASYEDEGVSNPVVSLKDDSSRIPIELVKSYPSRLTPDKMKDVISATYDYLSEYKDVVTVRDINHYAEDYLRTKKVGDHIWDAYYGLIENLKGEV